MPNPFGWFFSQNLDYFRPYKNQVKPGYKDYPIKFMVNLLEQLGPLGNIKDHLRPYWTFGTIFFYPLGSFWTMLDHCNNN